MPPITTAKDLLKAAQWTQSPESLGGANVTEAEYKMLEEGYNGLPQDEQIKARVALRREFPELHGHVVNDHK